MAYPDLMEEKQQLGPRIPDAQQAVKPIVPLSGDFFNNQLNQELGNVSPPPHSYQDFLKQNNGIAPVTFGNKDGMAAALESQYFDAEHNWKKETGANMGRGGGGGFDPQAAYQAAVLNNRAYNPNLAYVTTQWLREQMAKDPATAAQMADQKAQEEFAASRKYTPAMTDIYGRLAPEGKAQFDAMRDKEILQKLFPQTPEDSRLDERGYVRGSSAANNPIKKSPQEQFMDKMNDTQGQITKMIQRGDTEGAAQMANVLSIINNRIDAGTMNGAQALLALENIDFSGNTTNMKGGRMLAESLGMRGKTGERTARRGGTTGGENYDLRDVIPGLANSEGALLTGRRDMGYADAIKDARAASDQKMQEQEFKDKQGQRKEADIVELTAPDGTKINVLRQPSGSASEVSKTKKEEAADGIYQMPGGGVAQIFNGKTTTYKPGEAEMGMDGNIYPYISVNGKRYSSVPDGSKSVSEELDDLKLRNLEQDDVKLMQWIQANQFDPRAVEYINLLKEKRK